MFKGFDFIKNSFTASVSGSPDFLFPFIRNTSLRAAARIPAVGGRSALNIPSTAVKQARGDGACMRRTLSGEAITAASCTFSVGLVNSRTSSGFFCTAAICTFSVGSLILWIASGLSRTAASCARSCNRLFSFGMAVSFLCYISGAMIGGYSATVLHLTKIKRISGTHVRDIRKWNSRWCGRFRPLQSFPCTA